MRRHKVSWSTVRLLRSCCTVPMMVLAITTPKKVMFAKDPTNARQSASTIKTRLKKRKNIIPNDLGFAPGRRSRRTVIQPRRHALGCLVPRFRPWLGLFPAAAPAAFGLWLGRGRLFACRARQLYFDKALSPSFYNNIGMSFYYKRDCMNKYSAHSIIPDFIYALNFALAAHSSRALAFLQKKIPAQRLTNTYFPAIILLVRYG